MRTTLCSAGCESEIQQEQLLCLARLLHSKLNGHANEHQTQPLAALPPLTDIQQAASINRCPAACGFGSLDTILGSHHHQSSSNVSMAQQTHSSSASHQSDTLSWLGPAHCRPPHVNTHQQQRLLDHTHHTTNSSASCDAAPGASAPGSASSAQPAHQSGSITQQVSTEAECQRPHPLLGCIPAADTDLACTDEVGQHPDGCLVHTQSHAIPGAHGYSKGKGTNGLGQAGAPGPHRQRLPGSPVVSSAYPPAHLGLSRLGPITQLTPQLPPPQQPASAQGSSPRPGRAIRHSLEQGVASPNSPRPGGAARLAGRAHESQAHQSRSLQSPPPRASQRLGLKRKQAALLAATSADKDSRKALSATSCSAAGSRTLMPGGCCTVTVVQVQHPAGRVLCALFKNPKVCAVLMR